MKNSITCLLLHSVFVVQTTIYAQTTIICMTGRVVDVQQQPLANTNILLLPDSTGTITDLKGYFELNMSERDTIRIILSHIGYQIRLFPKPTEPGKDLYPVGIIILERQPVTLQQIVITPTMTRRSLYLIDQPVNLVPRQLVMSRNPKTTAEVLREETGIFIQKTGHGGGSPIIRGFGSNRVLILIDGIRMNNSTYRLGNHQYLTTVDYNMLAKVEVVRGPGSTLYGSDAIGGLINLITKSPDQFQSDRIAWNVQARYASADREKMVRLGGYTKLRNTTFLAGMSLKEFGDLRRGSRSHYQRLERSVNGLVQSPSGFSAYDLDLKAIHLTPGARYKYTLAYQGSRQIEVPRYDKYENNGYTRWLYDPQQRDLAYLAIHSQKGAESTLSVHRQAERRIIQLASDSPTTRESDQVMTLGMTHHSSWKLQSHQFLYGWQGYLDFIDSRRDIIETTGTKTHGESRYPDGSNYLTWGLFVQDELEVGEFLIRSGLRWSYFTARNVVLNAGSFESPSQFSRHAVTGSLGLTYRTSQIIVVSAHLGQAFRAPNMSDLGKFGESKGLTFEIPNFKLKPERATTLDLQFKVRKLSFRSDISVYYSRIQDLIASVPATWADSQIISIDLVPYKVKRKENIGQAVVYGVESAFEVQLNPTITLEGNQTYTYGHNLTEDDPVGGVPPFFGMAALTWKGTRLTVSTYIRFNSTQTRIALDDKDDPRIPPGGTPAWATWNLRSTFQVQEALSFQVSLENLFDLNYREHGSGINAPGLNLILSLRYSS